MRYLHTMVRVEDLSKALDFYVTHLGLVETKRKDYPEGRYTLVFLAAPNDVALDAKAPRLELTYNWPSEDGKAQVYGGGRNFGHLAYEVENIYETCKCLEAAGVTVNRPPRDGKMAFVKSPDGISIELLQVGDPLAPVEPWASMPNVGSW